MSVDAKKFLPKNTTPGQFMRPPTEVLHLPVVVNALIQQDALNDVVAQTARKTRLSTRSNPSAPVFRVGSEFEILLFSDKSDPRKDLKKPDPDNPNYSTSHTKNVRSFLSLMREGKKNGGLREDLFDAGSDWGRITLEIRTPPSDVAGYIDATDAIRDWFQQNAGKFGINPVIWSQHLHLSLADSNTGANILDDEDRRLIAQKGLVDIYHRAVSLLRLPENVESVNASYTYSSGNGYGVTSKGYRTELHDPRRIEGRVNNSDYATDPSLNLLLHLIGLKRGLQHLNDHTKLDKDYPLSYTHDLHRAGFTIGQGGISFDEALEHLLKDSVLAEELSEAMLRNLHRIVGLYPKISRGRLSLKKARERANDIVLLTQPIRKATPIEVVSFGRHS